MDALKYRAFISYSHRDSRWASWLHASLEKYRVPKALIGTVTARGEIPKRIAPIFSRDRAYDQLIKKVFTHGDSVVEGIVRKPLSRQTATSPMARFVPLLAPGRGRSRAALDSRRHLPQ